MKKEYTDALNQINKAEEDFGKQHQNIEGLDTDIVLN